MSVTSTGTRLRFRAAFRPPKPPPTMTTRCAITNSTLSGCAGAGGRCGRVTHNRIQPTRPVRALFNSVQRLTLYRLNGGSTFCGAEPESERGSGARDGLNGNGAAMAPHDVTDNGEAEARATGAEKRLEDAMQVFRRDSGSGVLDVDLSGSHDDADFPFCVHRRAGIAEEIVERPVDAGLVAENGRKAIRDFDIQADVFGDAGARGETANRSSEIDRFQGRRLAAA